MSSKKNLSVKEIFTNIAVLLLSVLLLAAFLTPFASVGFFLDGYPTVGAVLLGAFLAEIVVVIAYFRHRKKKRLAEEAAYRAENVTEYETDGGRLGILLPEYDKGKNCCTLRNGFPAIFSAGENPTVTVYRDRLDGRTIERIADRMTADREQIYSGLLNVFNQSVSGATAVVPQLSGVKLEEINIEDNGETVVCFFSFISTPISTSTAEVSYGSDSKRYSFELMY